MAVHVRSTVVRFEYLAHDLGHWCNTCRLPSGMRVWVAVHFDSSDGGSAMHLQQRLTCDDCGGRDVALAG
jgi:hypothetical protein